ncbi:uncharacterized protein LOC111270726 isoform X3 [Varroa jacobsoni]|uniref:uncharacterized protein LOC111270726 isoform X3 n=1 Tax=Varroa jacobsoni TaxID=62625 RepID=UPI000BF406B8|nr:uncharacterized protein LOC111270726 isoform X3 [Varroa jacobsoni]
MSTTPPAVSSRMARYRSCKKKRSPSSSQDLDSSPELTTASAKRTKRSSPPGKNLAQRNINSKTSSNKKNSSPEEPEEAGKIPVTNIRSLSRTSNRTPKGTDTKEIKEPFLIGVSDRNIQRWERPDVEELSQRFSGRRSNRAAVNGDVNPDNRVSEFEGSSASANIWSNDLLAATNPCDVVLVGDDDSLLGPTFIYRDAWTLKYAPNTFGTFVGNTTAVGKLEAWLREWQDPTRNMKVSTEDANYQSQQDAVSSALFIRGPPGVGKTALTYYVAHRLGYMVIEVNSSSERPGRRILADLQEATQSAHVEGTKVSAGKSITSFFKPTLGGLQGALTSSDLTTPISAMVNRVKVTKGKKTPVVNPKGTLQHFFTLKKSPNTKPSTDKEESREDSSPEVQTLTCEPKSSIKTFFKCDKKFSNSVTSTATVVEMKPSLSPVIETEQPNHSKMDKSMKSQKIKFSKNTIILFDDVDVIFEDDGDEGFWMALETVVKNSKKPCILTVTQGYESIAKRFRILQNAPLIDLRRPDPVEVATLVKRVCEVEQRDLTDYNVEFMCQYLASDVRRSLLQMEFETISSGLTQTVYPANKTFGGLLDSGFIDDALAIQMAYKKVGFNALYASLEDCLPFQCDDANSADVGTTMPGSSDTAETGRISRQRKAFEESTLRDLSEIFDELSHCDLYTGTLDKMGQEYLPSYERAKRWMERHPMETQDSNPRMVEELLEIEASVLLKKTVKPINRITERFGSLGPTEQKAFRFLRISSTSSFHNIHKQLEKVRSRETALEDVLNVFANSRPLARDYLAYLVRICEAEEDRRKMPRRSANRFVHYLSQLGIFQGTEKIQRIANFWRNDDNKAEPALV